jgi:pyruvate/2-oxoglutarate dehydrogenase complex dihydrolipoamide dehydrogenase (E3) component
MRDRRLPFCLITDPELARIGLNESQPKAKAIDHLKTPQSAALRLRTLSELLRVLSSR